MLRCTLLSTFFLCAYGATLPFLPNLTGRIVGGEPATIVEAPHHVGVMMVGDHRFGGSIISESIIITAFQCRVLSASFYSIRAGSSYHNRGGQVIAVSRVINHEDCNYFGYLNNDITLLFLASKLIYGTAVAPVALPSQGQTVPDDALSLVVGWGELTPAGLKPSQLEKLTIPIVNQQKCVDIYASIPTRPITDNMICAGNITHGFQNMCPGDSGGSLTVDGVLIGITSGMVGCFNPSFPDIWTRVPSYITWIYSHIL